MFPDQTKGIYFAVLNQGEVRIEVSYLMTQLTHQNKYNLFYSYPADKPIESNRNKIVQDFLSRPEYDYLIMLDGDIVPPLNVLDLADHDKDIISPVLYAFRQKAIIPLVLAKEKGNPNKYHMIETKKGDDIIEVDATGTGCICIARRVLEHPQMKHPFKNYYDKNGIRNFGLDLSFCKRAKKLGFKVWVDTNMECSHWTYFDLKMVYRSLKSYQDKYKEIEEKCGSMTEKLLKKPGSEQKATFREATGTTPQKGNSS